MATIGKHTRNFTVLFITSLGILGFMLFYIFGYIPENEKRINARNYRVLHRMGENISTSVINYSGKVGSSYVSDAVKKIAVQIKPSQPPDFDAAILNKLKENSENKEATGKFGLQIFFEEKDGLPSSVHNQQDKVFHYLEEKGLVYLDFPSAINKITLKELEKDNIRLSEKTKKQEFHVKIPVDSLLSPLIRFDTFTHLIILREDDASAMAGSASGPDSKKGKSAGVSYEVLYNSRQNAELLPVDTLAWLAHKSAGTRPADGFIAGVPYKIYALTQRVGSGEKWLLFGTMPAEKYEIESRAIPADIISFAALAFIILIMAFPFLKLILMNQQERLYARDVILSFLSLFVGLALVVLLLFDCYVFYGIDRNTEQQRLKTLSDNLTQNLTQEISLVLNQLNLFNQCAADPANCKQDFNNYWRQVNTKEITRMSEKYFPNFQRIFQTDSAGMMTHSWKLNRNPNQNNAKVSVNTRNYFKIINNGGGYTLPDNPAKFGLESITSFTDGEKYAVISTRSNAPVKGDKMPIIALATKLVTFYKPIFPPGYGFCVIDKEGKVLFHQNEDLNLNENLLEETNYDPRLKAALYGQTPAHFVQKYQGNQQQLYVAPIEGLPYFMVTYVNSAFNTGFNVNLLMLTAMFLSLYLFTIAIISSLIIFLNNGFSGVLFNWLWPQKNKLRSYAKITLAAGGTFFLVIWCTSTRYPVSSFFCFVFAAIYILIYILSTLKHKSFFQVLLRSSLILIILNIICLTPGFNVFGRSLLFQVLIIGFLLSLEVLFRKTGWIQSFSDNKIIQALFPVQKRDIRLYGIMFGSWLILTSGLPAFTLFRVAYNFEADLLVRYNQMHLAQALKNAHNYDSNSVGTPDSLKLITQTRFSYTHFFHHTQGSATEAPFQITPEPANQPKLAKDIGPATKVVQNSFLTAGINNLLASETDTEDKLEENFFLNNFISFFRPVFRNVLSDEYYLKSNEVNYWEYSVDNHNLHFSNQNQNNPIQLISHLPKFQVPFLFYPVIGPAPGGEVPTLLSRINISAWFFWADMVLLVALLCLLIAFLVNRLFNADLISQVQRNRLDLSMLHPRNKINIFLISLPHAPDLKSLIQSGANGYTVLFEEMDLEVYKNPGTTEEVKPLILEAVESLRTKLKSEVLIKKLFFQRGQVASYFIVKNFDYDPFSPVSLQIKNFLLQEVSQLGISKIILQSKWHPDCWEKRLNAEEAKAGANADYKYLLQNFLAQLSDFIKVYQPLQSSPPIMDLAKVEEAITTEPLDAQELINAADSKEYLKLLITQECSAASYLEKHFAGILQNYLAHYSGEVPLKPENIIFRLQSLAQLYYRSLWDACSEEEHYFLYDMAQDGLVNTKNIKVLSSLLGKGLMVVGSDGLLKIMNESFRGFILNTVNPLEALRFERSKAHASSWEVYRTPLIILLIGAVLFFFFTQKNSWANIIAILTAISSFVSFLPRLSFLIPSFLVPKEAKPSE